MIFVKKYLGVGEFKPVARWLCDYSNPPLTSYIAGNIPGKGVSEYNKMTAPSNRHGGHGEGACFPSLLAVSGLILKT